MRFEGPIFLTGASGFVGSHVLRQLIAENRQVAILLRPTTDTRRIADLMPYVTVLHGNLAALNEIHDGFAAFGPKAVLHLAWGGVKGADRNNLAQFDNVIHTLALYRLAENLDCKRFIGLGSQAEYGPQEGIIHEDLPATPTTLYGVTKLATAQILSRAAALSGHPFTWLRLFSSYGPQDDPSWMLPYLISRLLKGERPSLTKAEQVWDYIHVRDVASGIVAALDHRAVGFFNIGSGTARPLRQIIKTIRDHIDPALPLGFGDLPYRPDQVMHLEADISALTKATGWRPAVSLEEGLRETIAWHHAQL